MGLCIIPDKDHVSAGMPSEYVFTHPAFRQALARAYRLQPVQVELSGENATVIPAFLKDGWFGRQTLVIGAGFDKTGSVPLPAAHDDWLGELLAGLPQTPIKTLEWRTTHLVPYLADQADKVELCVDIPTVQAVWDSLSTNTRKLVRRAQKQGFTWQVGNNTALLDEFYPLYHAHLHNLGSLPLPKGFFIELLAHCSEHLCIFIGYLAGKPVVASLSLLTPDEVYGAWSGVDPAYKKHNVFLAMLWHMVEYTASSGRAAYNLGRSSLDSNAYHFKRKLANRCHKIYYYRIPIVAARPSRSPLHRAAAWLVRHTPPIVMDTLSQRLLHHFY